MPAIDVRRIIIVPSMEALAVLHSLVALALTGIGHPSPPAPPRAWPVRRLVRWQPAWGNRTIKAAGLVAHVEVRRCGTDRPASEACYRDVPYVVATVRAAGMGSVVVQGEPGVAAFVGIGKLTPAAARTSLILVSDNGGSAGCVQIDLAVPQGTRYRRIRLAIDRRDRGTLCGVDPFRLAWPRDLTGHGLPEFRLPDPRFYCRFTSCAGTWYPPLIVALRGGRGVDMSSDPALARLYRTDMARARHACETRTVEAQGACAGYAADAARLGRLSHAWRIINAQMRRGCRVRVTGPCPDINRIPAGFPADLAPLLPDRAATPVRSSGQNGHGPGPGPGPGHAIPPSEKHA